MSNILTDIVDDVDIKIKPNKSNFFIKWTIIIATALISGAFIFGQIKTIRLNRLDNIEKSIEKNTETTIELKKEIDVVNSRIDKVYDDGYQMFFDVQQYNKKQFELFIDYGTSNKDLLKRMLEINMSEKNKNIEINVQQAKKESNSISDKSK